MLAALVVFGINTDLSKLHAAFGMSAAAALLTLIGAILALCSRYVSKVKFVLQCDSIILIGGFGFPGLLSLTPHIGPIIAEA